MENKNPNQDQRFKEGFFSPNAAKDEMLANKRIVTMPEKFLASRSKSSGSKFIIILVIVVVVLVLLGGGGYFVYQGYFSPATGNININLNANKNINSNSTNSANQNLNTNSPSNINANSNLNLNTSNSNYSFNFNFNTNKAKNQNINFDFNFKNNPPSSLDSDKDGLTNKEEELFKTEKDKPDTDNDGYVDGSEVENGYNPSGKGAISESAQAKKYQSEKFGYALYYPKDWAIQSLGANGSETIFTSPSGEFAEVLVIENPSLLSVKSWFLSNFSEASSAQIESVTISKTSGIKSIDGNSFYVAKGDKVYVLTHNIGTKTEVDYQKTFLMMVHTFVLPGV